ncbi:hypothetical protein ACSSS7_003585 [Eimeria intestinalis]
MTFFFNLEEALPPDDMRFLSSFVPLATMLAASNQQAAASAAFPDENVNPAQPRVIVEDTQRMRPVQVGQPQVEEASTVLAPDSAAVTPLRVPVARYSFAASSHKKKKKHEKKATHPLLKQLKKKYKRQKKAYLKSHTLQEFFILKYQTLAEAMKSQKQ